MKQLFILMGVAILFASCSSTNQAIVDFDKGADFSKYQTFNWYKDMNSKSEINQHGYNDLMTARIKNVVKSQMEGRDYHYVEDNSADIHINAYIMVEEKMGYRQSPFTPGYYRWYEPSVPYVYKEGKLYIDMVDARKKKLVWSGQVEMELYNDPEKKDAAVRDAVSSIFAKYTFRASQSITNGL
ncbi:DUF4136 domain-containing protein [Rapidithrix thailandica]|uniref:DUF4136 domain-containing protein n=1 Tax=Rapidithrix thailandica TaxID=413964 RepID=A0AAW9RWW6_9BACT